jgi:hypothetical protein
VFFMSFFQQVLSFFSCHILQYSPPRGMVLFNPFIYLPCKQWWKVCINSGICCHLVNSQVLTILQSCWYLCIVTIQILAKMCVNLPLMCPQPGEFLMGLRLNLFVLSSSFKILTENFLAYKCWILYSLHIFCTFKKCNTTKSYYV